jgi:3-dehydroquinate synthase
MTPIQAENYSIEFQENAYLSLNKLIAKNNYSKLFLLTDSNTNNFCSSHFLANLQTEKTVEILEIPNGEAHKNIDTCVSLWNALVELGADRKSLLINLGGGVTTDIGGFVATTFMRGFDFVHVPTSLLAMVDASVGGKNGVDLGGLKNIIGTIKTPKMVLIDSLFLNTLPAKEMRSGLAEMIKHGLIASASYFDKLSNLADFNLADLDDLIYESIIIKNTIVSSDPFEKGERKKLNFGHTLGHAIETQSFKTKNPLSHGEAIIIGSILALFLSTKATNFSVNLAETIKNQFLKTYEKIAFTTKEIEAIINLLKHDKKTKNGVVNFVLLEEIGKASIDHHFDNESLLEAFEFYKK